LKKCPNNTRIYVEEKKCLDSCYDYHFEYNKICYINCPNGTYRLFQNRNICSIEIPENYYLDNNDYIYKECYSTCKNCIQSGNAINHNCNLCKDNFRFFNESSAVSQNCYQKCRYNYYFTGINQYFCTQSDSCPKEYNILITQKRKCIDICKNDDEYIYNYNNICMQECPVNTKINFETKECKGTCNQNQIEFNGMCYNDFPNGTHQIFQNGVIFIFNNSNVDNLLNNIISEYIPDKGSSLFIQRDNDVFHVTNSKYELELLKNKTNNNYNISIIHLDKCEIILKEKYNINQNESLIFIKNEKKTSKVSEKEVQFDVYEPYTVNLSNPHVIGMKRKKKFGNFIWKPFKDNLININIKIKLN
jgi:hypothetical protein